jgi:flagellin
LVNVATTGLDDGQYRNVATTTDGEGVGLKINFTVVDDAIVFMEVASGGWGYAADDEVYIASVPAKTVGRATFVVDGRGTNLTTQMVEDMIAENSSNRGELGAAINSLEYAVDNMQTLSTNLADGISRIVDTDYAAETSNLTRTQILQQAATSMLAQANQMPNVILTLLK